MPAAWSSSESRSAMRHKCFQACCWSASGSLTLQVSTERAEAAVTEQVIRSSRKRSISALEPLSRPLSRPLSVQWLVITVPWSEISSSKVANLMYWGFQSFRAAEVRIHCVCYIVLTHLSASTYGSKVLFRLAGPQVQAESQFHVFTPSHLLIPVVVLHPPCPMTIRCSDVLTLFLFCFLK